MGRFEGYGVLVTGAGRGIGEAVARRLAGEGARVLVTDLDGERAEKAAAGIREHGGAAESLPCDVADRTAVEAAVAHAVRQFGTLDVLVNNAHSCHPDTPSSRTGPTTPGHGTSTSPSPAPTAAPAPPSRTSRRPPTAGARSSASARSTASRTSATTPTARPRRASPD